MIKRKYLGFYLFISCLFFLSFLSPNILLYLILYLAWSQVGISWKTKKRVRVIMGGGGVVAVEVVGKVWDMVALWLQSQEWKEWKQFTVLKMKWEWNWTEIVGKCKAPTTSVTMIVDTHLLLFLFPFSNLTSDDLDFWSLS